MHIHPNIAIVVIAYNRPASVKRLLDSLLKVDFENQRVPLIISIDYSGKNDVYDFAASFEWPFGEKQIIRHTKNLGLKNHVLSCGDLVKDYDAVVILEDDLVVSPAMYSFAYRAVDYYNNDDNIAAISLYSERFNESAMKVFEPAACGKDTFFIQLAESRGQIWMKRQWQAFREWYKDNSEPFSNADDIPLSVCQWDNKSWKKYHIKYFVENDKWMVYPYLSFSTCMGDAGEHFDTATSFFQVPLLYGTKHEYAFADFNDIEAVKYDAYLERLSKDNVCMDLYGQKQSYGSNAFVISSNILPFEIEASYGLTMRPHEMNVYYSVPGDKFFKYKLSEPKQNNTRLNDDGMLFYNYIEQETVIRKTKISKLFNEVFRRVKKKLKLER